MDVINLGWSHKYIVGSDFDLNDLRKLHKVEKTKNIYYPTNEENGIIVEVGAKFEVQPEKVEAIKLEDALAKSDQYEKWWGEANKEKEDLRKDLECVKQQLEEIKSSSEE